MKPMIHEKDTFLDAEFKDESPLKTVERIKGILKSNGIETKETWGETGVPYCYALRISVVGTTFGANGKGLSEEFALASGYGELMERLQLGYVGSSKVQKDSNYAMSISRNEFVSATELLRTNREWYEMFSRRLYEYTGHRISPDNILMQYADSTGKVAVTPYLNLTKGRKEYFSTTLWKNVYTTNGCAAGNTMEEAIVQGISEIVERHHQRRIIDEGISVPEIPDTVLKNYKVSYDIISYVRSKGFRVVIKDCSLESKFPVVCACIVDEKSGKYHTHFGAYPIFEIALERSLTESFQGRNIENIAEFDDFIYKKADACSPATIMREQTTGSAEKMPGFFVGEPKCSFNSDIGFLGRNNKELLKECVEYFRVQGYDVLVRDSSCLGFPTYQILIPGYSETFLHRLSHKLNDHRYSSFAVRALRNPSVASTEEMLGLLMHMNQMKKFDNKITGFHGFLAGAKLSAQLSQKEEQYILFASLAYVYYTLGRYQETVMCIDKMIDNCDDLDVEFLICLKRYLSLVLNRYDKAETKRILEYFHRPESVDKLYACLEEDKNPMEAYTLHCDLSCGTACLIYEKCRQKRVSEIAQIINRKAQELNFEEFSNKLQALLQ